MENDHHLRSRHNSSAAKQWAFSCVSLALLLLLVNAFLYANANAYILGNPIIFLFSLLLSMAVGITGIGSAMMVFRKSVPMWVRIVALGAFVLALLSLSFYCHLYLTPLRCPSSGCG